MRNFVRALLCLSLSVFAVARAVSPPKSSPAESEKKTSGGKADAKTLLHDAKKATAALIKNARADKDLDPKKAKNKPFWKSIHLVAKSLKTAETGLAAKNDDFFKGVADGRKAEEQMRVDWQLTDSKNTKVIENGKKLGHVLAILRTNFSKEAERKKKGGELTAVEKKLFAKIKADQKTLLTKIKELERRAKKDKSLEKGLSEIERQAHHILKEPDTVDAYVATLYLLDVQVGLVRGYHYYVDKNWRDEWFVIVQLEANYESSYSVWATSATYDWAVVNTGVDIQEGDDVAVTEDLSEEAINNESSYAENESLDMSEAEQDEVAADENTDEEVASADDDSMEDASDDEGADMGDDDAADDSADDDGGDDGGGD